MTFCIGIAVRDGLIALADTQVVRGSERLSKGKLSLHSHRGQTFFLMTSGLRSVRDKAVIYMDELLASEAAHFEHLHQVATAFGGLLQRVRAEDGAALADSKLDFNLHAIMGGHFTADPEPQLFQIYPEGNWIVAQSDAPYFIIGRTQYGRPILDRILTYDTPAVTALALAYLAFDATGASVTDVDFPIDIAFLAPKEPEPRVRRFAASDLMAVKASWKDHLTNALSSLPLDWAKELAQSKE